jgi:hypothetical protein
MTKQDKREAFQANPEDPRHGTPNGYGNLRCRCPRCTKANTDWIAEIRQQHPDYLAAQRTRQRAARIPRSGVSPELAQRLLAERAELSLRQAGEMNDLIDRQIREVRDGAIRAGTS